MLTGRNIKNIDRRHYYSLDGIRIFAATIVLLNHFASYSADTAALTSGKDRAYGFLDSFYGLGAVGVEIFFVISGLVISSSSSRGFGFNAAINFIYRRAQRILPILWISSSISLLALFSIEADWVLLLKSFIRSNILFPIGPYVDGVVWSLIVEAFFYFIVAISILSSNQNRLKTIAIIIAIISSLYNLILFLYTVKAFNFNDASVLSGLHRFPYKIFLLRYGVFFSLGMFIFILKDKFSQVIAVISSFCFVFCAAEIVSSSELAPGKTFVTFCVWAACVITIAISVGHKYNKKIIYTPSVHNIFRFLGNLSYPLYLNHFTIGIILTYHLRIINNPVLKFVISLLVVIAVSSAILYLENHIRRFLFRNST